MGKLNSIFLTVLFMVFLAMMLSSACRLADTDVSMAGNSGEATTEKGEKNMLSGDQAIAPIDQEIPAVVETATFALG